MVHPLLVIAAIAMFSKKKNGSTSNPGANNPGSSNPGNPGTVKDDPMDRL